MDINYVRKDWKIKHGGKKAIMKKGQCREQRAEWRGKDVREVVRGRSGRN